MVNVRNVEAMLHHNNNRLGSKTWILLSIRSVLAGNETRNWNG